MRRLLGHRLVGGGGGGGDSDDPEEVRRAAREEWLDLLDGECRESGGGDGGSEYDGSGNSEENAEHPLWKGVSAPYRSIIRAFLVHFHSEVLRAQSRRRPPFDFSGGSVGNFFFAGARTFFGSLPAAIFLFSKVAGIPSGSRVLPAALSEDRLVLGAKLQDGSRIRGQYRISHGGDGESKSEGDRRSRRGGPLRSVVKKEAAKASLLPSPVSRVAYLLQDPTWERNGGGGGRGGPPSSSSWDDRHEIHPEPNPLVLDALFNANCVVYGCGSLFTSVLPSLVLDGVGPAVAELDECVPRALLLNGWHDRETSWVEMEGPGDEGINATKKSVVKRMDAAMFVQAVVDALDGGCLRSGRYSSHAVNGSSDEEAEEPCSRTLPPVTNYVTHVLYPRGTEVEIDQNSLDELCRSRIRMRRGSDVEMRGEGTKETSRVGEKVAINDDDDNVDDDIRTITLVEIPSVPAHSCADGSRSGGGSEQRIFESAALVDALLELARSGSVRVAAVASAAMDAAN